MKSKRITSLTIQQESWGLLAPDEDSSHELKINRRGTVSHNIYAGSKEKPARVYKYKVGIDKIEEFFNFLENKIKIHSWTDDYSVDVCDGYHWTIIVRYSDNRIKKIEGTVEPPPEGKKLERLIKKMILFEERPWIF